MGPLLRIAETAGMNAQTLERPQTMRALLKAQTHERHVSLDRSAVMRRLFADDLTRAEYAAHLARLLGFHEPLERAAQRALCARARRHFMPRAQTLRADLSALGWSRVKIARAERCEQVPVIEAAGGFGYLYVVLGSLLGARVIAKRLQTTLASPVPLEFYGDRGGESERRWSAFCEDLEHHAGDKIVTICNTANATFDAYAQWMCGGAGTNTGG